MNWQVLDKKNEHERDKHISFDEEKHIYTVNGTFENYISVTTIIHKFFEEFDALKVISKMKNSPKWITNKYYGKTDEEIMNEWEETRKSAAEAGTKMHLEIEKFLNEYKNDENTIESSIEWKYFLNFWNDHKNELEPFRTEWKIWTEEYKIAGSIDCVFYSKKTNNLCIYDWKRSKEIKMHNSYTNAKKPIDYLSDCNYIHYSLQLNLYKWILEKYYNVKIDDLYLVILHPNNNNYLKIQCNDYSKEIELMLNERKKALSNYS